MHVCVNVLSPLHQRMAEWLTRLSFLVQPLDCDSFGCSKELTEIWVLLGTTKSAYFISSTPHSESFCILWNLNVIVQLISKVSQNMYYDSSDTNPPKQLNTILNKCMEPVHTVLMIRPDNRAMNMHCYSHWINLTFSGFIFRSRDKSNFQDMLH